MTSKKITPAYRVILGAFLFTAVLAACNNGTEKKDAPVDSPKVNPSTVPVSDTPKVDPNDTTGMEKGSTRPVKTTD
jgi:hypothetical protein